MQREIGLIAVEVGEELSIRIGITSGSATAGVIGVRKPFYDIWGDTVNMASRMESSGTGGHIQVSESARQTMGDDFFFEDRGSILVKGKGQINVSFLTGYNKRIGEK